MEVSSIPEDIQRACRLGDVNLLKKILKDQPRLLNQVDDKLKWSPLYRTVICGHLEATQYLLGLGADPNIKNNLGETALHQAVDNSQYKLVKILLKHKADPSMQQNDGTTPLHQSALKEDEKIVSLLLKYNANPNIRDNAGKTPLDISSGHIKLLMSKPAKSKCSEKSLTSSPILLPSPEPLDIIPYISMDIFTGPSFAVQKNLENYTEKQISDSFTGPSSVAQRTVETNIEKQSVSTSTIFEPDAEKSQLDIRPSKAFSFGGGEGKSLINWLESVKLEFLYEDLMNAGYDDVEQMASQMMSGMPITEESLIKIGIKKSGHRRRLLAALDEETRPFKSSRRTYRSQQSNLFKCCVGAINSNPGFVSLPELKNWLELISLGDTYILFVASGYDDLEHLLALMNSRWEITDEILQNEVQIKKQAHRYKIIAKLRVDSAGFETMKKGGTTGRYQRDDMQIEKSVNSTVCSCIVI